MNRTGSPAGSGPYDEELEARLRASLSSKAGQAPNGDYLATQIIAAAERGPELTTRTAHQPRGWRTWTLPLIAAGAVAAVVGTVVGVTHVSHDTASPGSSLTSPPPFGNSPSTPQPTTSPTTHSSAVHSSGRTGPAAISTDVHGFQAYDATFIGTQDGWAIGTADCLSGTGRCTAVERTMDGHHWHSYDISNSPFTVGGDGPGDVDNIRFANKNVGYAYGPDAFYTTADGGRSWTQQPGGAYAVETLDGNVIRVEAAPGCPPGCTFTVWTSDITGRSWTKATLPEAVLGDYVQLVRSGTSAGLLVMQNPAGGAENEQSTLYTSDDDGATWTSHREPCPQTGPPSAREVDSTAIAANGDGYTLVCSPRQKPARAFVITSSGSGYSRTGSALPAGFVNGEATIAGAPSTVLAVGGYGISSGETTDGLQLSFDGGRTWAPAAGVTGQVSFVGFESGTVGRAITDGGRTVWTTHDGGRTWSEFTFPG